MFLDLAEVILGDGMGNLGNDVIESQRAKGLRASGKSAASIRSNVNVAPTQLVGQLWGSVTFTWQQNGRKPNKSGKPSREMVNQIAEWLQIKGLDYSPWAVATNIAKHGIPVPNQHNPGGVLSDPLNAERVKGILGPRLRGAILSELKSFLVKS